jgi:hypothetical protein
MRSNWSSLFNSCVAAGVLALFATVASAQQMTPVPPHDTDVAAIRSLIADWRTKNGFVSTIDVSYPLHAEHERKLHRWLYGDELKEVSPLPDFYAELQESFREIAKEGGGADVKLGEETALVNNVLVLAFGTQWKNEVGKVAKGR